MLRSRMIQLPVIPISFLLLACDFGVASAAGQAPVADTQPAQADTRFEAAGAMARLLDDRLEPPSEGEAPAAAASPGHRSAVFRTESLLIAAAAKSPTAADNPSSTAPSPSSPAAAGQGLAAPKIAPEGSPSILQMLDGHERELMIGAAIAAGFFVIGWISGGNYYVRRERRRRTKLRF